jgi:signal transduction histidine kinase/CheY-like chemotaxis protein
MMTTRADGLLWREQPAAARVYVAGVTIAGLATFVAFFPHTFPRPLLFAILLISACLTSVWKVNLPIALTSGSTLSVSYAANLTTLLLLGPQHALVVAVAGVWAQCTYHVKRTYPLYRTLFSVAAEAITMAATGLVYLWLGGGPIGPDVSVLMKPLVGAIATYFICNTGLVAGAIALSTGRSFFRVWHDDFLWSGASFVVAGTAGAIAAVVIDRGELWKAVLMLAPIYLTYSTYRLFVGRLEDQQRHVAETRRLHEEAIQALAQAHVAETALAAEKERLALTLAEIMRLEQLRNQLLDREQAARASAEQANQLKDQFLAIVSHELRTPLNAVLGWADMLRRGSLAEEKRARAVDAIYDGAKRQSQLIDDLLDVARIMSGKLGLSHSSVDPHAIIRAAIELVQPASDAKSIHLSVDADTSIGAFYADGARLQQIIWNLLSNAIKFTPDGGAIRLGFQRVNDVVELAVTDSGPGIAADFLPSVFEPFRQADASTTRAHGGLGLGLAIVKQLVEAHGGTVRAESDGDGRGAVFTVCLPMLDACPGEADEHPAARSALPGEVEHPAAALEGLCVLVVDDDEENREVVAASLEGHHAVVLTADSVPRALELLDRQHVDVLLTDIGMPGEDGYTLIRRLRASSNAATASIPAVALTAFARPDDRHHALLAGFQLHLAKPIEPQTLVGAVATLARLHQAGTDQRRQTAFS